MAAKRAKGIVAVLMLAVALFTAIAPGFQAKADIYLPPGLYEAGITKVAK